MCLKVINFLKNNCHIAVAEKLHISKTCASNIFKGKLECVERFEENKNESESRKIKKTDNFEIN